jgi:hypothetical protein
MRTPFRGSLVVLAVFGGFACGEDEQPSPPPEPKHPVTRIVNELQDRFEAKDVEGVCALMTKGAQTQAGEVGHSDPTTCPRDVRRVFGMIDGGGGWLEDGEARVAAVREQGNAAMVTLASGSWRGKASFLKEDGAWKLAGFFGIEAKRHARIAKNLPDQPFPEQRSSVTVTDADGNRCAPIEVASYTRISGGCKLRVTSKSVPVEMLTPFGGFKFDECSVTYRIAIDAEGRTWTDEWQVEGPDEGGCADVIPCYFFTKRGDQELSYRLPWKGRIRGSDDGGFRHDVDVCLRTCIGLFAGDLSMTLAPEDGGRWRLETAADTDNTGIRFNDSLTVAGDPVQIKAAELSDRAAIP